MLSYEWNQNMEINQMVNESFEKFFYDLMNNIFDKILK
jgi:hypothetical protein